MKIIVVGGHGLIGSKLVEQLGDDGHHVVAASRRSGVDAVTGEGLAAALDGAEVVIDASNSPSFEDDAVMDFFQTATRNLLAAGVAHHVAVSVVGCDRLRGSGYMRAKVAQEELIAASPVPYSIVRATQFYEFVGTIAYALTVGDAVRVPPARIQPVAAGDAAAAVGRIAVGTPAGGIVEVAGPEPFPFEELIRQALSASNDPRDVVVDQGATYFGAALDDAGLLPAEDAELGKTRFEDWLGQPAVTG